MASPTIESLCCLTTTGSFSKTLLVDFHTISYNLVSFFSSLLGIAGALFQIFRKENSTKRVHPGTANRLLRTRGRVIIKWLAVADLLAATGILIRSISWMSDKTFGASETDSMVGQFFCIVTSGWIHFFYTATYFWTVIYALDVKLVLDGKKLSHWYYHIIGWTVPAILCLVGLLFLYLPDLNCHNSSVNPYVRFLPNYLSTFIPILCVMIVNPTLYIVSFSSIEKLLASTTGRFAQRERQIVRSLKLKFLLITLVFYVCWLPNIINGVILWTAWNKLPKATIITIWYLMAILNPLQAVLNCFVYRSWDSEVASRRPFWLHPVLWLEDNISFSPSSSSGEEPVVDANVSAVGEHKGTSNLFQDVNPWQRMSSLKSFSEPSSTEKTPLLGASWMSKRSLMVTGEQSESSDEEDREGQSSQMKETTESR